MMELKRWREVRDIPLTLEPKHSPCDDGAATRLVIAAKLQGKDAHRLSPELARAIWELDQPLGDAEALAAAGKRAGVDTAALKAGGPRTSSSTRCTNGTRRKRWRPACSARRASCCLRVKSSGARTGWKCSSGP